MSEVPATLAVQVEGVAEVLADAQRDACTGSSAASPAGTVAKPVATPAVALFTLPSELDPRRLVHEQRAKLQQMLAALKNGGSGESATSGPGPGPAPAPEPESPEHFLARSMAVLDGRISSLDATMARLTSRKL